MRGSGIHGAAEATTTNLFYHVAGQRTKATDPRSLNTTYLVDTRGLLTTKTSPDAGAVGHKYDQAGNARYSQDAKQAAAGQVFFTTYDFANRPLVSGQAAATFSSLDPFGSASWEATTGNWLVVRKYDAKPTNVFPWSLFWTQISPLALDSVRGRLAGVASKSNGSWQASLFSYDVNGRVTRRSTYTHANGGTTVLTALNTTILDSLDLRGAFTKRALTVGANTWNQWYDYDGRGLLWKVFASTTSTKPGTQDVTYTYRPSGQVASRQFVGGPSVPLIYTIRERLYGIGNPASTAYPFSAQYLYHANGTVTEAQFYSGGSPAAQKRYRYVFATTSYDALNRLKSADHSPWNGSSWTSTLAYDLTTIGYDLNGNLTGLRRYRETATLIDDLGKTIASTSNRLTSVTDAAGATAETWDAEAGSFTYDANGNMLTAPGPYLITAATYDHQNLPLSLTRSGTTTTYRYDGGGQRIAKQVGSGNREMYVQEGALNLGVVTVNSQGSTVSWFWNVIAGNQVVGRQPNTGDRRFYHTDLLGSTRAVTDSATILESYDFDPWGVLMPGRTLGSGTKEGFTGKERDPETGLDYFGARYNMPAVARFAAVDPQAAQFPEWAAYNYTLDNPMILTDPDGECPVPLSNCAGRGGVDVAAGFTPFVSTGVDAVTVLSGRNPITGEKVGWFGRSVALVGLLTPLSGGQLRAASNLTEAGVQVARHADEAADATRVATRIGGDAAQDGVEKVVTVSHGRFPQAARHIDDAQATGQPATLTVSRSGSAGRRAESTRGTPTRPGLDRDEYPPAMFTEGGSGASVRHISPADNRAAGACIGAQCRGLPQGTRVRIQTVPE